MKKFLTIFFGIAGICGMANLSGNEQNIVQLDSVLASVNGIPVSLSDVASESGAEEIKLLRALEGSKAEQAIMDLRKKIVDEIIDRKLILAEYAKKPFQIDNEYLDSVLDSMAQEANCRTRSEFYKKLRANQLDVDEFKRNIEERIRVQFIVGRELYHKVNISPKMVYEYYHSHPDEFKTPKQIRLSAIFVRSERENYAETVAKIQEQLNHAPAEFHYLAKTYSDGVLREKNGFMGEFSRNNLRSEFAGHLKNAKPGIIQAPLKLEEGTYFLLIDRIIPGNVTDYRSVEPDLRKKLETMMREQLYNEYVAKLRSNAIIKYFF